MTSDERREVAERLRGPFDVCGCGRYTYLNGTLYGMQVCAKDELTLRDGMRRLADLLDPTCRAVHQGTSMDDELVCSECGASLGVEVDDEQRFIPKFCSCCGARVVSGDD